MNQRDGERSKPSWIVAYLHVIVIIATIIIIIVICFGWINNFVQTNVIIIIPFFVFISSCVGLHFSPLTIFPVFPRSFFYFHFYFYSSLDGSLPSIWFVVRAWFVCDEWKWLLLILNKQNGNRAGCFLSVFFHVCCACAIGRSKFKLKRVHCVACMRILSNDMQTCQLSAFTFMWLPDTKVDFISHQFRWRRYRCRLAVFFFFFFSWNWYSNGRIEEAEKKIPIIGNEWIRTE